MILPNQYATCVESLIRCRQEINRSNGVFDWQHGYWSCSLDVVLYLFNLDNFHALILITCLLIIFPKLWDWLLNEHMLKCFFVFL